MDHKPASRIVLVMVDDDEDDCYLVEAALYQAQLKCEFHCVEDGFEMMDYLNQCGRYEPPGNAPRPDIILLDLNMPKMSGREVLSKLKKDPQFRCIPVIVLTTSTQAEDIAFSYDEGANTYIVKQPSFDGLLSAIQVIKEYWLETATLPPRTDPQIRRKD